jgi:hypothetical protein
MGIPQKNDPQAFEGDFRMPGYILEKLGQAKLHAKNIYEGKSLNPGGLSVEWSYCYGALESAKQEAEQLVPKIKALMEIQECIDQGGEAVFTVKRIKGILDSLDSKV